LFFIISSARFLGNFYFDVLHGAARFCAAAAPPAAALTAGVPDPIVGERIHALVVPRANASIDERDLRQWIAERIENSNGLTSITSAKSCRPGAPERSIGRVA
jgi:acyl-CoA synthetase (AMP-forming)/AMP-acid ligase II